MNDTIRIDHIEVNGSGVVKTLYGLVSVPFTLPRECVEIAIHGKNMTVIALKEKSPERIEALFQHFRECGGCLRACFKETCLREPKPISPRRP